MSLDVNRDTAQAILLKALSNPVEATDEIGKTITSVLRGTHKTYRYVLFTALLAKATNERIDILSIQAKDNSIGAYDARSLCHKVVVPFERDHIPHSLGDSNEPYLNKPARFERLSLNNAVRDGNDLRILQSLVETLPKIKSKEEAFKYLSSAVFTLKQINQEYEQKYSVEDISLSNENSQAIYDYIDRLTERACEGETCPLIVSTLEELCFPNHKVIAHNVNECGASSKEVGDIDIYQKPFTVASKRVEDSYMLDSAIEVKDKYFSEQDVQHAISKFRAANLERTLFVYGKNARFDEVSVNQMAARYGRIGTYCAVISILDYTKLRLYNSSRHLTLPVFIKTLFEFAKKIKVKEETLSWLKECIDQGC